MEALANLVAKGRNHDVDRHNEHATAVEQLSQGQMKIAQFTNGLTTQYGQLFKALSNRLDAVQQEGRSVRIITSSLRRRLSTEGRCERLELQFITMAAHGLSVRDSADGHKRTIRGCRGGELRDPAVTLRRDDVWKAGLGRTAAFQHRCIRRLTTPKDVLLACRVPTGVASSFRRFGVLDHAPVDLDVKGAAPWRSIF
jgi:hypothetical protein